MDFHLSVPKCLALPYVCQHTSTENEVFHITADFFHEIIKTRICAAEMAVRYAALSACRKVRMPSVRAEKYMCVIVIR